ncbi:MAG TPA: MerR family transcriptional regulator [Thermomicrobiales bacterium]|nr:MerR family transcriptional regulator [Thermomicrobiales bacterium]
MTDAETRTHRTATYSLDELTERSGVTARTVRYYIAEGLLPPPNNAGPRATYSDTHLNRLHLIGRLKEAYLPLREIRRQLQALSDAEIDAAVATETPPADAVADPGGRQRLRSALGGMRFQQTDSRESAADYLKRVSSEPEQDDRPDHDRGHIRRRLPAPPAMPRPGMPWIDPTSPTAPEAGTNWKRLSIAREAELLIEESTYERRRQQIDSAIEWMRRILNNS